MTTCIKMLYKHYQVNFNVLYRFYTRFVKDFSSIHTTHVDFESFESAFDQTFGECEQSLKEKLGDCLAEQVDDSSKVSL